MVFSSFSFMLVFLPVVFFIYVLLHKYVRAVAGQLWLIVASLYFYAQWELDYLWVLLASIVVNYSVAAGLSWQTRALRRALLWGGVAFNMGLLGYFKYTHFAVESFNQLIDGDFFVADMMLPLAISFFTFQQIAYLVDSYHGMVEGGQRFISYCLFVCFFPQLIAGPIVHHREMMPQFTNNHVCAENIAKGLAIFALGLAKKVIIADTLSIWVNVGFANAENLSTVDAWLTSFCYTFQLYFDFSGYADMAIGVGLLFGITLPLNFNSPYCAANIQLFWRSWHMTLSRWLKNYVYFPVGGSRLGANKTLRNLFIVAMMSGIWHGAGWTFILWGLLHALALMGHRLWAQSGRTLPHVVAWGLTFLFINVTWVTFRAENINQAWQLYQAMFSLPLGLKQELVNQWHALHASYEQTHIDVLFSDLTNNVLLKYGTLAISAVICLFLPNSQSIVGLHQTAKMDIFHFLPSLTLALLALMAFVLLALGNYSEFIYFNF